MTKTTPNCWLYFSIFLIFLASSGCHDSPRTPSEEKQSRNVDVKQLKLDDTDTDDNDLKRICEENPNLVELTLGGTGITDAGLENLLKLKKLKKLRLSKTAVTDAGMGTVARCEYLEDLDLSQTAIGDFGVWELVALPRLKRLNLYTTQIRDSGLDAFGKRDHRSAGKIVWLNLDKCPITDAGIPKLSSLTHLEWLHLGRTGLTDAGLEELAKLRTLQEVSVTNTQVTKEGIAKLRAALPDCKINENVDAQEDQDATP